MPVLAANTPGRVLARPAAGALLAPVQARGVLGRGGSGRVLSQPRTGAVLARGGVPGPAGATGPASLGQGFKASRSTDQTVLANTWTVVQFDTIADNGGYFTLGADGKITANVGLQDASIVANVHFEAPAAGNHGKRRIARIRRLRGGQEIYFASGDAVPSDSNNPGLDDEAYVVAHNHIDVAAGDVFWLEVWHDATQSVPLHQPHTHLRLRSFGGPPGNTQVTVNGAPAVLNFTSFPGGGPDDYTMDVTLV